VIHTNVNTEPQALQDLHPHLDPLAAAEIPGSIEDDRQAVAARVRNLLGQANITEKRVGIGGEFKAFRNRLRRNGRHDGDHTGWQAAFSNPNPFVFSRRGAECHIQFDEAFGHLGSLLPSLPHTFRALHLLATFKLSDAQLKSKCLSGEIAPNTTEGAIWKLGAALGKVQPKLATKKSDAPVLSREAWFRLSRKKQKKLVGSIGLNEVLAAYSPTVDELLDACGTRVCNELWKRAKGQLQFVNVEAPKVLTLPAPAKSLPPPRHDIIATWDAAAAEDRQKFVRERQNEFLAAVV
jgi:hypothetical protein